MLPFEERLGLLKQRLAETTPEELYAELKSYSKDGDTGPLAIDFMSQLTNTTFYLCNRELDFIVLVPETSDVCCTRDQSKATTFSSQTEAQNCKDKWDLWEYEIAYTQP